MYRFWRFIFLGFVKIFFPYKVIHKERAKVDGPCVIIANHLSNCDPFMIGSCFKEKMYFLGKKEWFEKKILNSVLRTVGGIPVDRGNVDLNAIKECLRTLKNGDKLGIFPEGTRNKTKEELLPLKSGAAVIAVKAKVNFLPVYIYEKSRFLRRNKIYFGEVVSLEKYFGMKITKEIEEELVSVMRNAILDTKKECLNYLEERNYRGKKQTDGSYNR